MSVQWFLGDPQDRIDRMVAAVDWSKVEDEQTPASEFPHRIRQLWDPDRYRRYWALDYLESVGFGWGVSSPATVELTPLVVALLQDERVDGVWYETLGGDRTPVRARLLELLGNAAYTASWGGTSEELRRKADLLTAGRRDELVRPGSVADLIAAEEALYRLWLREHARHLVEASRPWLDDPDPRIAQAAVYPTARFGMIAAPACRQAVEERLLALAMASDGHQAVQATAVLELVALGADTTVLLEHPSLPLRAIAALSPSTAADPRSLTALEQALGQASACDDWLEPSPPMLHTRLIIQFAEVAAARAATFADVLPGAFAVASAGTGWRQLLPLAFPAGWPGRPLSGIQREFLRRIVDQEANWHPEYTTWKEALHAAGLPPDRDACRRLVT